MNVVSILSQLKSSLKRLLFCCQVKLPNKFVFICREREYEEEFSHFLEGRDALVGKKSAAVEGLSPEQVYSY